MYVPCTIVAGECGLCSCCAAGVALHSNRMPVQCYGRRVCALLLAMLVFYPASRTLTYMVAVAGIGDLREKREEVNRQILQQEEEKAKIQKVRCCLGLPRSVSSQRCASPLTCILFRAQELSRLTDRLSKINESLSRKLAARNEFDNTIQETEAAYMKVRSHAIAWHRHGCHPLTTRLFSRSSKVHKHCCMSSNASPSTSRRRSKRHRSGGTNSAGAVGGRLLAWGPHGIMSRGLASFVLSVYVV